VSEPTAGPWRLLIPAPVAWINANDRGHWRPRAALTAEWRRAGAIHARKAKLARIAAPVAITAFVHRLDNRRADAQNVYPTAKAVIDGLVDHGVLDDDSNKYVTAVIMRPGARVHPRDYPLGLLTLELAVDHTDAAPAPERGAA
jgi:crossover junction endodeoxyribonuclease RusA